MLKVWCKYSCTFRYTLCPISLNNVLEITNTCVTFVLIIASLSKLFIFYMYVYIDIFQELILTFDYDKFYRYRCNFSEVLRKKKLENFKHARKYMTENKIAVC